MAPRLSIMSFNTFKTRLLRLVIAKITLLICLVFILDRAFSTFLAYVVAHDRSGELRYLNAIEDRSDIVVLGASKAETNYNCEIINRITGRSVYNLGTTGSTLLVQYAQLLQLLSHYKPQLIIFEITGYDLNRNLLEYRAGRTVDRLLIHSNMDEVAEILNQLDPWHKIKTFFHSYRYTSVLGESIINNIKPRTVDDSLKGFSPKRMNPQFKEMIASVSAVHLDKPDESIVKKYDRSDVLVRVFQSILSLCKSREVTVLFVKSPNYREKESDIDPVVYKAIINNGYPLLVSEKLPFDFDSSDLSNYSDELHLSEKGAGIYSQEIAKMLGDYYK